MTVIKEEERCRVCNGVGLVRNDDPMSDRTYGHACPSCNGTGIAGDPLKGCILIGLFVVTTFGPLIYFLWP